MTDFWAKTGKDGDWLSLDRHLDDVAAVAALLWDEGLSARQRAWVSSACRIDRSTMRAWWIFLAGIHDVGKANPRFQGLVPDLAARVVSPLLPMEPSTGKSIRHDQVSGAILALQWGPAWAPDVPASTWQSLAAVISGHHGVLRNRKALRAARTHLLDPFPEWSGLQRAVLDARAERLGLRPGAVPSPTNSAVVLALAGLLTVADWIGSDQERFPVTMDPARAGAETLARQAVASAMWAAPRVAADRTFGDLFTAPPDGEPTTRPEPRTPRASQRAVIDVLAGRDDPCLLLVEDRTGSGKTEAALWAAYRGLENGARGIYVGMPTRATANQLHRRTERFIARVIDDGDAQVRLLHSGIETIDPAIVDGPTPGGIGVDGNAARDAADARAWFLDRRRGLLERFGVGTVDQALLATLGARHFAVRLWGLQGKVVIVDEIHAYETYTSTLLDRAIEWLAALDCPVVLLSATLPAGRRAELVAAYRRGRLATHERRPGERVRVTPAPVADAPYPRITVADADAVRVIAVEDSRPPRTFAVARLNVAREDDGPAVADRVAEELDGGGCVAVVCNTVALAQQRHATIRERLGDGIEVLLLHARLRPAEREPLERRLMAMLGPESSVGIGRPDRLVVVATQVIEQSLDVDFDLMLSDVAPIDLLVQRAGRVHRHDRRRPDGTPERPAAHGAPRLVVLDTPGDAIARPYVRGVDRVYAPPVLHRTRRVLDATEAITEPVDLDRLIGAVYPERVDAAAAFATDDGTSEPSADEATALARADERFRSEAERRRREADRHLVAAPGAADPPWEQDEPPLADADAPGATAGNAAATRWITEPTVGVVVLGPDELPDAANAVDDALARSLLRRAVSLRTWPLGVELDRTRREPGLGLAWQPPGWRRHPLLRHHLLVRTDDDGQALPPAWSPDEPALPVRWTPIDGATILQPHEVPTCATT